jgi:hypothetical protein
VRIMKLLPTSAAAAHLVGRAKTRIVTFITFWIQIGFSVCSEAVNKIDRWLVYGSHGRWRYANVA